MTAAGPLDGVRVLDLSRVLAGPHAGRMLVDLGADVIKVEPPEGDLTRFSWPRINSMATYFAQQNCGKRNISLDLRHPEAVAIVRSLAGLCDVVLENFRPGVMTRMGLDPDELLAAHPRLVIASISGYGQDGPWRGRRAYAPVVQAEAGITWSQAMARGKAANDVFSHGDVYTALECLSALLAALYQRERTGVGDDLFASARFSGMFAGGRASEAGVGASSAGAILRSACRSQLRGAETPRPGASAA